MRDVKGNLIVYRNKHYSRHYAFNSVTDKFLRSTEMKGLIDRLVREWPTLIRSILVDEEGEVVTKAFTKKSHYMKLTEDELDKFYAFLVDKYDKFEEKQKVVQ